MPITRMFLDWSRPALPAVVDYLLSRHVHGTILDLESVVLVVSGGRAGRRLLELLVTVAERRALTLLPPEMTTMGHLPERLYESRRPFASDLVQQLTWVQAIRMQGRERCRQLLARPPADSDFAGWLELGRLLSRQHRELAAEVLDFADVLTLGGTLAGFDETDRWQLLSDIQSQYLRLLDELELWDLQTARRVAIKQRECQTDRQIVLVATTDMNQAMRQMLDLVAEHVTALIHAPPDWKDHFDAHGCLLPRKWRDVRIPIQDAQIQVADKPADQAVTLVDRIASYDGHYRADEIVIGVLDERMIPQFQRELLRARLPNRWVVGKTVAQTAPFRLLDILSRLLARTRFRDFAELVRHPDVHAWVDRNLHDPTWLARIDDYHNEHLPATLEPWPTGDTDRTVPGTVRRLVLELLRPLQAPARPLASWASTIADILAVFYGAAVFDPTVPEQYYTLKALGAIRDGLLEHANVPASLQPTVSATEAITELLAAVATVAIPTPSDPGAIQMLGWLELPLDTAPALIVTSFNEGYVPSAVNSDLFLPNALRRHLGLVDNERRYARDAYALCAIAASRPDVTLITGRRSVDGDPLTPSRLLFATDDITMARRARRFFAVPEVTVPRTPATSSSPAAPQRLMVPRPMLRAEPLQAISVTAFRAYLACPFRFYLRYVLQLKPVDDTTEELDGAAFGNMLHDILAQFGAGDVRTSTDPEEIELFLHERLSAYVTANYGRAHLPALDVQLAQARARLTAFARWQAERADQGWEIMYTETKGGEIPPVLKVDAKRCMTLKGRIDRIDRRGEQWAILDYKTSDTAKAPKETHLKSGEWIDLQLPLYRHIVESLEDEIQPPIQLGYVVLPKDVTKTGLLLADWDETRLREADKVAVDVARKILNQQFWPPTTPAPQWLLTEFAAICQDSAFRPNIEPDQDGDRHYD